MLKNEDFVILDPPQTIILYNLPNFSWLDPQIRHAMLQKQQKEILSIGYLPKLTIYEVSSVQNEDFVKEM